MQTKVLKSDSVVILNSGGLDSLVVMALMANTFKTIYSIFINYGHQTNPAEKLASENIAIYYGAKYTTEEFYLDLWYRTPFFKARIPTKPFIPNRNFIFFALATTYCDYYLIPNLAIGWDGKYSNGILQAGATDAHKPFADKLCSAFDEQSTLAWDHATSLRIYQPLANKTKEQIIKLGKEYKVPFELSRSCYSKGKDINSYDVCNKCSKCKERKKFGLNQFNYNSHVTKGKIYV